MRRSTSRLVISAWCLSIDVRHTCYFQSDSMASGNGKLDAWGRRNLFLEVKLMMMSYYYIWQDSWLWSWRARRAWRLTQTRLALRNMSASISAYDTSCKASWPHGPHWDQIAWSLRKPRPRELDSDLWGDAVLVSSVSSCVSDWSPARCVSSKDGSLGLCWCRVRVMFVRRFSGSGLITGSLIVVHLDGFIIWQRRNKTTGIC